MRTFTQIDFYIYYAASNFYADLLLKTWVGVYFLGF